MLRPDQDDRLTAAVDLVGRTGAKHFEVGYVNDDVPIEKADWYAHAQYRGARITVEHHTHPVDAAEALAVRLLTGAKCKCGKLVQLTEDGGFAYQRAGLSDGTVFTADDAQRAGLCYWRRDGARWVSGCGLAGKRQHQRKQPRKRRKR